MARSGHSDRSAAGRAYLRDQLAANPNASSNSLIAGLRSNGLSFDSKSKLLGEIRDVKGTAKKEVKESEREGGRKSGITRSGKGIEKQYIIGPGQARDVSEMIARLSLHKAQNGKLLSTIFVSLSRSNEFKDFSFDTRAQLHGANPDKMTLETILMRFRKRTHAGKLIFYNSATDTDTFFVYDEFDPDDAHDQALNLEEGEMVPENEERDLIAGFSHTDIPNVSAFFDLMFHELGIAE